MTSSRSGNAEKSEKRQETKVFPSRRWVEKCRKLHFLCPECDKECDHVIGELVFPDFKETYAYAFRVCWKCQMVRVCKPFGWRKQREYPIRWRSLEKARREMYLKRGSDQGIDLSPEGIKKQEAVNRARFLEKRRSGGHRG